MMKEYDPRDEDGGKVTPYTNVGIAWNDKHGVRYKLRRTKHPTILISIRTYVGCPGAIHYYGHVKGDKAEIYDTVEQQTYSMAGYGDEAPRNESFDFDARRVLRRPEKDLSGDVVCKVGESTGRFNLPQDAFEECLDLAVEKFKDGPCYLYWKVRFDYCGDELDRGEYRLSDLEDTGEFIEKFDWDY